MKFQLEENHRGIPDDDLLADLRAGAKALGRETITMAEYEKVGKTHPSTIQRRFRSWVRALELAGLQPSRSKIGITDVELFENLRSVWLHLGRQPRYDDVKLPMSQYSAGTYENRFGSWSQTLRIFVDWANADSSDAPDAESTVEIADETPASRRAGVKAPTRRDISERQRFRVLMRDGFRCMTCGASPLKSSGVELHVDHVVPWSKGGQTTDDNLQGKCSKCNLGKGNAFTV